MIHLLGWGRTPSSLSLSLCSTLYQFLQGDKPELEQAATFDYELFPSIALTQTGKVLKDTWGVSLKIHIKKSCWYKTAVVNMQLQVWATYNSRFNLNNLQILLNQMKKKKKTTNELWPWRLRTCLCVWVSPKIHMCNFDPKKMCVRGKWKADTIKGNAWLPWEWFLADCLPAGV